MKLIRKCLCLLLALTTVFSLVTYAPLSHIHALEASSYIASTYASNINIKTNLVTGLYDVPSKEGNQRYSIGKDTQLHAVALHKNTSGEYWYQVIYYNLTLYVKGADTTFVSHLTGDVSAKNLQSPAALQYGSGFPIGGEVTSSYNDIGEIRASLYEGSRLTREPVLTSSDNVNGKYYSLNGSTVDTNLWFNLLSTGVYTYVVSAEAKSHYVGPDGSLKTSSIDVFVEEKQCVVTSISNPNPVLHQGIDVSVWNGDVDWAAVATQVDFVILRASWEETADTKFSTNAKGCEANGIPYGVYVYSYAETAEEAIGEAEYVLSLVDNYDLSLPIYFDFEDECQMNLSTDMKKTVVKAFCDTIYAAGYQPGIYTYKWILTSVLTDAYFKTLPTWVAEINGASYTSYAGGLTMWQYSWTGRFNGMSGDVDCNYMYGELPGVHSADKTYLKSCEYYPSNLTVTLNANANVRQYPSTDYTLMKTLSSGDTLHVTGLYKNTYGNFWYQIEHDGETGYIGSEYADVVEYRFDDISVKNPQMAGNLNSGSGYYIRGDLSSVYNNLLTVNTRVYLGEDTDGDPVLSSSYSPDSKFYSLYKSEVDYGLAFGTQSTGYYTYEISADVKNYSASGKTLSSKTENVVVWTAPYTVNNSAIVPPESTACSHNIVTQSAKAPTCTETGLTEGSYCSLCSEVFATQTVIPANGHSYTQRHIAATCLEREHILFNCLDCGDTYKEFSGDSHSQWSETKPEGVDESLIETKTQYSFSEYQTIKSYQTSVEGYTLINKEWESQGEKTQECVKEWPSGFDTTHTLYSKYNKTPKADYTDTYYVKTELGSEEIIGYIYYHWCTNAYSDGPYNRFTSKEKTDTYPCFHAFYSTKAPEESDTTASDGSVRYDNLSCCGDTYWYYNVPVYKQTYTDYKALYTHSIWTAYSEWSDEEVTASWDRNVKTRTLYRYLYEDALGDHSYDNGVCVVCGEKQPLQDMCLFGFINGFDYADKEDYEYLGSYCFSEGKLVTTFTEDSYVGVKTVDNEKWYMTNGYPGDHVTSAILYNTDVLEYQGDKLFVPKGREITFTLEDLGNDSFVLSYTAAPCLHERHNTQGECVLCGGATEHNYSHGGCLVCGATCPHTYSYGVCMLCSLPCTHEAFENGLCTTCETPCSHGTYENGFCTICLKECEHNFKNGLCTKCRTACDHSFLQGECTICKKPCSPHIFEDGFCTLCQQAQNLYFLTGNINGKEISDETYSFSDGTLQLTFTEDSYVYVMNREKVSFMSLYEVSESSEVILYSSEFLGDAGEKIFIKKDTTASFTLSDNGDETLTLTLKLTSCQHKNHNSDALCTSCGAKVSHSFTEEGICSVCSFECSHSFEGSLCTICGFCCTHSFENGLCDLCGESCSHLWEEGICSICKEVCPHSFRDGSCDLCHLDCRHNIKDGICTTCGKALSFTLAGLINGSYKGCEDDFLSTAPYPFTDKKLTLTTTEDSFVFLKTTDNRCLFLPKETTFETSAELFSSEEPDAQKMLFVPGGVKAEFTLSFSGENVITLSYEILSCDHIKRNSGGVCVVCSHVEAIPSVTLKYAELTLEEKLRYRVYFDTENLDDLSESNMGIAVFESADSEGTVETASRLYSSKKAENGYLFAETDPLYAHTLSDTVYFRAFATLSDGSYVYSDLMSFSGSQYAQSVIRQSNSPYDEKALMVSLLNYGAELQKFYDYNTDRLMNADLTEKEQAYALSYSPQMLKKSERVSTEKAGEFLKNAQNIVFYPIVKYDCELFGFEVVLKSKDAVGNADFFYWEESAFESCDVLTRENASGSVPFSNVDGQYHVSLYDVYAKDLSDTLYIAMQYRNEADKLCSTGILSYSVADFMSVDAENENSENHTLAKSALVYAYYAESFFGN